MRRVTLISAALLVLPTLASAPAHAQAVRTWVSGTGDDLNVCSRTAPCKTFAGAISKTAVLGEINCLDPGGFGTLTITKSITISCEAGTAGISAAGTNGINVNAAASDLVHIKGLDIDGYATGGVGIRVTSVGALIVQDTVIRGFNSATGLGVQFAPTTAATFTMFDSTVLHNGSVSSGGGIQIAPTGSGSAKVSISNVKVVSNYVGIGAITSGPAINMQIMDSVISNNSNIGIVASASAVVRIGRSAITNNFAASSTGNLLSFLDNQINGNSPDVTPASAGGYK
jgi:hypothetical protein